ncbi:hypothetical protein PMAYCL1PPCAC_14282, partial [Pristionchus mayeri]
LTGQFSILSFCLLHLSPLLFRSDQFCRSFYSLRRFFFDYRTPPSLLFLLLLVRLSARFVNLVCILFQFLLLGLPTIRSL